MTEIVVDALGVRVGVELSDEALLDALSGAWAGCLMSGDNVEAEVVLAVESDHEEDFAGKPLEAQLELLTQLITVAAVGARAGELLMFHACAVADPLSGDAVVLIGPSGMGKTTIAAALGRRWSYVTDETAAIAPDGSLLPYPKPLSVLASEHPGKDQVSPTALGLRPVSGSLKAHTLVLLDREADCEEVEVEVIRTVEAIALLAEHTSYLQHLDRPLHRIADVLRGCGGLKRVTYRDAEDLEPLVASWLGDGA